ncbi:MAG: hypothetical protein JWM14_1001 [Chitinophagaceae bacterium]|nr:hypothetical protein [Chitinophagaceae bacterium]
MIKKALIPFLFIFTLCTSFVKAQEGREWIVAGQPYWKIPVAEEAVYKIPFTQLNSAGISTSSPNKIQLWFRGVEQSIYLDGTDLYFYAKGNDGSLDSLMYEPSSSQSNKYYSLFSDTTYCFLTISSTDGKRLNANAAGTASLQANHRHTETIFYADEYYAGWLYSSDTHISPGDIGEGWFSSSITQSGATPVTKTIDIPISNLFSGGADPELEIVLVGTNQNSHNVDILINNVQANSSDIIFSARNVYKFKQTFSLNTLTNNQPLKVGIRLKGIGGQPDYVAISYIIVRYPQTMDVSGKTFYAIEPVADNTAKTINLTGFNDGAFLWDISSEGAYVNLGYTYSGGTATTNVSSGASKIIYANTFKSILDLYSVDMVPYTMGQGKMLLISHKKLLAGNGVADYAAYRAGTGVSVTVTDVTKLYNLYTYGEKHPMAIKRYCKEELNSGVAEYLFIVGKGINYDYFGTTDHGDFFYRKNSIDFINNTHTYQQLNYRMEDLIPPYGWPSSDLYYTITDGTLRPKLTTGRLSARTNADVLQYLNKVMTNDTLSSNIIWRKHLIHLSGGKPDTGEIPYFASIVNGFKAIVEGPIFGGKVVRSYVKNPSVGAVDTKLIYSVADEVNKGLSYITFFGHSSPSIIDLDIGNVSNPVYGYMNKGKYPLLLMNGCQSAEFFIMGSIPEDWIMTPEKGALLTLGHGDIGYPNYMQSYTTYFYNFNFADSRFINSSIGDVQSKTLDTFLTYWEPRTFDIDSKAIVHTQATQFVLQGDPTVKLYKPLKTDYAIAGDAEVGEKKVFIKAFGSGPISAMSDSFGIAIPITNYGLRSPKPLQVRIRHTVTNNNTVVIDKTYPIINLNPIGYVDTFVYTILGKEPKLLGINKFEIMVDPGDSIAEFNENNNVATLEYFVPLSSVSCLYPIEYSVVHDQPVNFVAQSIDLFQSAKNYHVEIDTSHLYNSPARIIKTISSGALVTFTQTLLTDVLPSDSLVYYWRIRFDDLTPGEDTLWSESSFIYIKNSPDGWSQSEYPQLFKDTYKRMTISPQGALSFTTNTGRITATTQADNVNNQEIGYNNNNLLQFIGGLEPACGLLDGAYVIVFDAETTVPYLVDPSLRCGTEHPVAHRFLNLYSSGDQAILENFLNTVKKDEFILFMTSGRSEYDTWSASLRNLLSSQFGAQHLANLASDKGYMLLTRKRAGTIPLQELYSTNVSDILTMDYQLVGRYKSGSLTSTLIGPATSWGTMYKTVQLTNDDFAELKVIRINVEGKEIDTIGVPLVGDVDLAPLVPVASFPYIRLLMNTADTTDFTPAYLKKWQVIYGPAPEGTIDPFLAGVDKYTVTDKNQGESFTLPFAFTNISNVDFTQPLRVVFTLRNDRGSLKRDTITIGLLPHGHDTIFYYTVNIGTSVGRNVLQVYVNPKLQREVYYQNNVQEVAFNVQEDKTHPVIGAMFDGVHIFDGDVVSPSPYIAITLADNNNLLSMGDSTTLTITLIDPNGVSTVVQKGSSIYTTPIWGQDPIDKSKFRVEFKPNSDFINGKYKLVIQGKDASGNRSSNQNLEINFEVVNESTITNFYPYPNPFSTSCRFVFSLTGKDIPEDIKIQIMTVSGKVVREIFKSELGNIHIGDNITDYAWDGRDEFGDKLANGVYIYRVIIKNQNDKFDHRETSGDKAFKKGYGKLYILR